MSQIPLAGRRPALLLALLAVAACDTSGPVETAEAGFEAEVRGAFSRTVEGDAAVDSLAGVGVNVDLGIEDTGRTITALRLGARDADDTFYLIGTTAGPLAPGTYPIQSAGTPPPGPERTRFAALYRYDGGRPEGGVALSTSGTLTVTAVTDDEIAGSFVFDAQILDRDVKENPGEPDLSVEGAFRIETLDRPARPNG